MRTKSGLNKNSRLIVFYVASQKSAAVSGMTIATFLVCKIEIIDRYIEKEREKERGRERMKEGKREREEPKPKIEITREIYR